MNDEYCATGRSGAAEKRTESITHIVHVDHHEDFGKVCAHLQYAKPNHLRNCNFQELL